MSLMASADGPMNARPHSPTISAKWAFSAKKPYPGWIASAPVIRAADITEVTFR
jgi:hypothetical protein